MEPMLILIPVVVFTAIIMLLVALLTAAKKALVAEGDVTILINNDPDKAQKVAPGQSLLSAMAANKIFIPSACGGGGTCAMCKCKVIEGGGDVLPTEVGQLSLRERKDHVRLACQVKVKQDMHIELEEEIFGVQKFECEVISNENVATFIKAFTVRLPEGMHMDFEPGGYIQIDVPKYKLDYKELKENIQPEYHDDWDKYNVWDGKASCEEDGVFRAYSMANYPAEGDIVMLNIRIATPPPRLPNVPGGVCSSWIFSLKPGDKCVLSGPFGEFKINETKREMVYIGGGAGMAPLRSQLFHLFNTEATDRKVSYWYGARSLKEMFYWDQFQAIEEKFPNFKMHVAMSDPEEGWTGLRGFIHQVLLEEYLSKHEAPEDIEYYICGPPLMLKAVLNMLDDLGVPDEMIRFDDFG